MIKTDDDVMVDIETLSSFNNAAIIQIGACVLDDGSWPFLASVSRKLYHGDPRFGVDLSTVKWWDSQPDAAKDSLRLNRCKSVHRMLNVFANWLGDVGFRYSHDGQPGIWANPPQFDLTILRHAYQAHGLSVPWHYRQERCARTLWRSFGHLVEEEMAPDVSDLIKHRADHDAIRQARGVRAILESLS